MTLFNNWGKVAKTIFWIPTGIDIFFTLLNIFFMFVGIIDVTGREIFITLAIVVRTIILYAIINWFVKRKKK